ncbi:hypothetical protein, partial [Yoonia sp.]|uniref:hypothetical protein n=1 Tax=Yoonia sp. TaxID=2212373 RepID=UPI0025DB7BAA
IGFAGPSIIAICGASATQKQGLIANRHPRQSVTMDTGHQQRGHHTAGFIILLGVCSLSALLRGATCAIADGLLY